MRPRSGTSRNGRYLGMARWSATVAGVVVGALALGGCAAPKFRYVHSSDRTTYLKVPRDWAVFDEQDLLELSRADAGVSEVLAEPVRVDELVRHAARRTGVAESVVELPPSVSTRSISVDKRRLERVLVNLLENACVHGRGVHQIRGTVVDRCLRIEVEDLGPGVPDDERERIFERFFRGRAAGQGSSGVGAGLGLALVAEHVRAHHGRVWVERGSVGARFVVELPVA